MSFLFIFIDSFPALFFFLFFFNDTATTEIYTLSLHDALPISGTLTFSRRVSQALTGTSRSRVLKNATAPPIRSEEHTSELQSHSDLVCRLLLEKKKKKKIKNRPHKKTYNTMTKINSD